MKAEYKYRKPLDDMKTTAQRCKWFAVNLGSVLPINHREVVAFSEAYKTLENPVFKTDEQIQYLLGFISAVINELKSICEGLKGEMQSADEDAWHLLNDAVQEIKAITGVDDVWLSSTE